MAAPEGFISGWTPFNAKTLTGGVGTVNLSNPGCVSQNASIYISQIVDKNPANYTAVNPSTGFTDGYPINSYSTLNNSAGTWCAWTIT